VEELIFEVWFSGTATLTGMKIDGKTCPVIPVADLDRFPR